jgi:hypothetical protein
MVAGAQFRPGEVDVINASTGGSAIQCELLTQSRWAGTTSRCLACHDGSIPMPVQYAVGAAHKGSHSSHPVEVFYATAAASREHKLHAPSALPAALVMPQGMVTCVTCHDGKATTPYHVAIPNETSRLCFSCHAI